MRSGADSAAGTYLSAWQMTADRLRGQSRAVVGAAAARALDVHGDPAAVGAAHGGLDPLHAGPQRAEAGETLERRGAGDLDPDRASLRVVQAERPVVAVDGHDGPS